MRTNDCEAVYGPEGEFERDEELNVMDDVKNVESDTMLMGYDGS